MNGIYNPSSGGGGGGGSPVDNTSPLYQVGQLDVADNVELLASAATTVVGNVPIISGYTPVGITKYAIWDGTSGGYGYGYGLIGNHYIENNKVYLLVHNRSASTAIKIKVIVFILYIRDGSVSTPLTKLVNLNYGLGQAKVTTCGKLCMVTVNGQANQNIPRWEVLSWNLPKPAILTFGPLPYISGGMLQITEDGALQNQAGVINSGAYVMTTITYITA